MHTLTCRGITYDFSKILKDSRTVELANAATWQSYSCYRFQINARRAGLCCFSPYWGLLRTMIYRSSSKTRLLVLRFLTYDPDLSVTVFKNCGCEGGNWL